MISAATRAAYEEQATACMVAAEKYQPQLLALGVALSGSKEQGMELFQQASLSCHDAIQCNGFKGDAYHFYLRRAIKNLHYRTQQEQRRYRSHTHEGGNLLPEELTNEWELDATERQHRAEWFALNPPSPEYTQLAEKVMAEAQARFAPSDRVALRLSLWGMSCQEIAEHIGKKDRTWVWRRLAKMRRELRKLFQDDFDALAE